MREVETTCGLASEHVRAGEPLGHSRGSTLHGGCLQPAHPGRHVAHTLGSPAALPHMGCNPLPPTLPSPGPRRRWWCSRRWWHGSWTPPGRGWAGHTPGSGPPPAAAGGRGGRVKEGRGGVRESHNGHRDGWVGRMWCHVANMCQACSQADLDAPHLPTLCSAVLTPPLPSQPSCTAPALLPPGEGAAPLRPGPAPAALAAKGRRHHQAALQQQQPPQHCAPRRAGPGCCQQAAPGYWRRCCCCLQLDCQGRGRYRRPRCCAGPGDR